MASSLSQSDFPNRVILVVSSLNAALLMGAVKHIGGFWGGKAKIPLPTVGDYNDAVGITQDVKLNMTYLVGSWALVGVLGFFL
jgi:hypothetical protein